VCVCFPFLDCFFSKCFSNFRLSRLTFSFNFCPLLLLRPTTNYCDIYNLLLHAHLLLLFNKLYCIVIWNLNSSNVFCLIRGMSCINYYMYLLKRILDNYPAATFSSPYTLPFTDNNMIRKYFLHIMLFMDTY